MAADSPSNELADIHIVVRSAFELQGLPQRVANEMADRLLTSDFGESLHDWIAQVAPIAEHLLLNVQSQSASAAAPYQSLNISAPVPLGPTQTQSYAVAGHSFTQLLAVSNAESSMAAPLPPTTMFPTTATGTLFQSPMYSSAFTSAAPAEATTVTVSSVSNGFQAAAAHYSQERAAMPFIQQHMTPPPAAAAAAHPLALPVREALLQAVRDIDLEVLMGPADYRSKQAEDLHSGMSYQLANADALPQDINMQTPDDQLMLIDIYDNINKLFSMFWKVTDEACKIIKLQVNLLLMELNDWREQQRVSANAAETREKRTKRGRYLKCSPNQRKVLFEHLHHLTNHIGDRLVRIHKLFTDLEQDAATLKLSAHDSQHLYEQHQAILRAAGQLLKHTLVIYNHPMQVIKMGNQFALTAIWLCGQMAAQLGFGPIELYPRLVPQNEDLQPDLHTDVKLNGYGLEATNVEQILPKNSSAGTGGAQVYRATFNKLKWTNKLQGEQKRPRRAPKRPPAGDKTNDAAAGDDEVAHTPDSGGDKDKLSQEDVRNTNVLHFLVIESSPLVFPPPTTSGARPASMTLEPIRAVSLPMVLMVGLVEEELATCTIFWRNPFGNRNEVAWDEFKRELNALFYGKTCFTKIVDRKDGWRRLFPGRGLPEDQQEYLKQVYTRVHDNATPSLTLPALKAETIPSPVEKHFSLWQYVFRVLKTITDSDATMRLWNEGAIYGFVSSERARHLLARHAAPKTGMLARFSDGQPGAVALARVWRPPDATGPRIDVVEPWTKAALKEKPLVKRLFEKAETLELLIGPGDSPDAPLVNPSIIKLLEINDGVAKQPPTPRQGYVSEYFSSYQSQMYSPYRNQQNPVSHESAFTMRSLYESASQISPEAFRRINT